MTFANGSPRTFDVASQDLAYLHGHLWLAIPCLLARPLVHPILSQPAAYGYTIQHYLEVGRQNQLLCWLLVLLFVVR